MGHLGTLRFAGWDDFGRYLGLGTNLVDSRSQAAKTHLLSTSEGHILGFGRNTPLSSSQREERSLYKSSCTMAKKKTPGVPNRHLYTRISFLYQAATYLSVAGEQTREATSQKASEAEAEAEAAAAATAAGPIRAELDGTEDKDHGMVGAGPPTKAAQNMSRKLLTDLRAVTLKSQIRISPDIKRTICKHCDTLLIEGQTCSSAVENKSKGGKKPWADVLVIRCHTCSREKRFPVDVQKQKRRSLRSLADRAGPQEEAASAMHLDERRMDS